MKDFTLPVDTATVAHFFDVTVRAVQHWGASGCPKISRGRFDLKKVLEWWLANIYQDKLEAGESGDEMRAVKLEYWREKAAGEAIKNKLTLGELIPKEEIIPEWAARVREVANGMQSLAMRLPPLIAGKDQRQVRDIVKLNTRQILENFSRHGRFCYPDELKEKQVRL